ncbi:hypothetical protein G6F37_009775 [Rhizopus arrhizus]|nr:hypothetical protein G6F38_010055 [Rhizopus arrhizus]KAG1154082.1 hypothetical protein G6F37_009775 [Rhizopus arrhizus]
MKNETYFPVEENVTPVCRSAVYPTCTELDALSTIDHHSPKADHINHAFTAGGKLTWFQSIPFENKNKPKDERKQKDGYVNWTSSAPTLKLTGPVHSDFTYPITDESPPKGTSYVPTVVSSASEPIPNRLSYSRHSLSESHKCIPRYDSYSHPIKLNSSSKDHRQRESVHFSTPNNPQDNFPDSYDHFEPTPNMLAAMPRRQKPRYEGDHYTPKWVRYTGHLKQGYCDSCIPGKWLQLKNSAYWYHKQFYHGISSVSGKPFMKPIKQRLGKGDTIEGLCHQCQRFVPASNAKKKNNYMLWYRHAHKCHLYDKPRPTSSSKTSSVSSTTSMTD